MSIAILGGIDRLIPHYMKHGRAMGFSNIKVFSKKMPNMVKRLSKYGAIVICTGNVAHTMVFSKDTVFLNLVRGERDHENYGLTHTIKHIFVDQKEKDLLFNALENFPPNKA